jgi:predicted Zn-dependent peptidase
MKVIVVENDKIPVVSFQLTLDIDPVMENEAKGYVSMAGSLMRAGTENRSKEEIDEETDFIGATLSTYSTGMFASSLTRHTDKLLELMSDVLFNPVFPQEELDREINQTLTGAVDRAHRRRRHGRQRVYPSRIRGKPPLRGSNHSRNGVKYHQGNGGGLLQYLL